MIHVSEVWRMSGNMKKLFWPALVAVFAFSGCGDTGSVDDDGGLPGDGQDEVLHGDDGGIEDAADVVLINDAAFILQNVPSSVEVGASFPVEITMQNTGTTTWTAETPNAYRLGAENPRDNTTWGIARITMAAGTLVAPGETNTFRRNLTAPAAAGTYDFQWQMVQEDVEWFGQTTDNLQINVTDSCVPDCTAKCCGGNGCGGDCPDNCAGGQTCDPNTCQCVQCVPLTCAQADVICGTAPDGCGGEITCGPCCGQCSEVFNDELNGSTLGTRSGGEWINGGGWQTHGLNNRIIYAFSAIHCGYLEVDVRNFDPTNQYIHNSEPVDCDAENTDCYVHFVSLYRGDHGNHHTAADNCESQLAVQATGPETASQNRTKKFKLKASTTGWDGGGNSYSNEYNWDTGHTYHLKLEWNSEEILFFVDGQQKARVDLSWPGDSDFTPNESPECTDNNGRRLALTHFFLGRDFGCQGCLDGPIYSNLVIYDCNP